MTKFYLNKAANLSIPTPDGMAFIEFNTLMIGTSVWGVLSTDNQEIQNALSEVKYVKEISKSDYDQYLKKKPKQIASSNWPKSLKTTAPEPPKPLVAPPVQVAEQPPQGLSLTPDRSKVYSSSDFESASTALSTPAEVLSEQGEEAFASNRDELAEALGMKVWHARFKFYWARKDKPAKVANKGYSVSAWKSFIEKVQYEAETSAEDGGEDEGSDKE